MRMAIPAGDPFAAGDLPEGGGQQVGHDLCQRSNDHEDDDGCEEI
jgi:hypothetical protein